MNNLGFPILCIGCVTTAIIQLYLLNYGRINTDEGFYLTAAKLLHEGWIPYRDFSFTQGPLMPVIYAPLLSWFEFSLLSGRILQVCLATVSFLILGRLCLRVGGVESLLLFFLVNVTNLDVLYNLTIIKTYSLSLLMASCSIYFIYKFDSTSYGQNSKIYLAAIFASLGFLTRYTQVILLLFTLFMYCKTKLRGTDKNPVSKTSFTVLALVTFLPMLLMFYEPAFYESFVFHLQYARPVSYFDKFTETLGYSFEMYSPLFFLMLLRLFLSFSGAQSTHKGLNASMICCLLTTWLVHALMKSSQAEYQTFLYPPLTMLFSLDIVNQLRSTNNLSFFRWIFYATILMTFLHLARSHKVHYGLRESNGSVVSTITSIQEQLAHSEERYRTGKTVLSDNMALVYGSGGFKPVKAFAMGPFSWRPYSAPELGRNALNEVLLKELIEGQKVDFIIWHQEFLQKEFPSGRPSSAFKIAAIEDAIFTNYTPVGESVITGQSYHKHHVLIANRWPRTKIGKKTESY